MARKQSEDSFSEEETARRMNLILRGAFDGPPTPLKDIPTRAGQARKLDRPTETPSSSPTQKPRGLKRKIRPSQVDDR
jgi:hypothetical protein